MQSTYTKFTLLIPVILSLIFISCQIELDAEKAAFHFKKGEEYLNQGQWAKAGKHFKKATRYNPNYREAHEKYQDVEYYYFEKKDKITKEYQVINEKYPDNPLFPYLLGRITKWDSTEKTILLKKSIKLDSTFIPAYRELLSNLLFKQNYNEAYEVLLAGLKNCPNSIELLNSKAFYLRRIGEFKKLKQTYQYMIEHYPDSSQIVWALRELANLTDDHQEKIQYLEKVLDFDISNRMPFVYSRLFRLYEEQDSTKAISLARKATALVPPIDERRVPSNGYHFLFNYYLERDTLKALELAKELLQSENKDPDLHTRMANKLIKIGKEPLLAIHLIKKSIKLNKPKNVFGLRAFGRISYSTLKENAEQQQAYFLSSLGWAYFQNGEYDKAIETLKSASGIADWAEAQIQYRLGQTYEQLDKPTEAMEAYTKSLTHKEDEKVRTVLEQLAEKETGLKIAIPEKRNLNIDSLIADAQLEEAKKAADFTLKNLQGKEVSLSDFKGKVVVLDFWSTSCGPCVAELPHFQKLMDSFKENPKVAFLTISADWNVKVVKKFMKEKGYTFPVLMNKGVDQAYGVRGIPTLFVIDQDGKIRYKHVGYNASVDFEGLMTKEIDLVLGER